MVVEFLGQRGDVIFFRRVEVGEEVGQEVVQVVVVVEQFCGDCFNGFLLVEVNVFDFDFLSC